MARALMSAYNRALNTYPLLTQCTTTGFLLGAGDVIAQKIIEKQTEMNWKRTTKFAVFGFCFIGPVLSKWFRILERMYGSTGKISPLKKVATDQILFCPLLNVANIAVLGLMSGDNWNKIEQVYRNDYKDIMIANYKLWPAVQMVNFYLVPINYRVPVVALVSIFWNIYYTWKLGDKQPKEEKP